MPLVSGTTWYENVLTAPPNPSQRLRAFLTPDQSFQIISSLAAADPPGWLSSFDSQSVNPPRTISPSRRIQPRYSPGLVRPEIEDVDRVMGYDGKSVRPLVRAGALLLAANRLFELPLPLDYDYQPAFLPADAIPRRTSVTGKPYCSIPTFDAAEESSSALQGRWRSQTVSSRRLDGRPSSQAEHSFYVDASILDVAQFPTGAQAVAVRGGWRGFPGGTAISLDLFVTDVQVDVLNMSWHGKDVQYTGKITSRATAHQEESPTALLGEVPAWTTESKSSSPRLPVPHRIAPVASDATLSWQIDLYLGFEGSSILGHPVRNAWMPRQHGAEPVLDGAQYPTPGSGSGDNGLFVMSECASPTRYTPRGLPGGYPMGWIPPMSVIIINGPFQVIEYDVYSGGAEESDVVVQ